MRRETGKNAFGEKTFKCSMCGAFKERVHFYKASAEHYGIRSACSACKHEYMTRYYHEKSPLVGAEVLGSDPVKLPQGDYELLPKGIKRECRKDSEGWNTLHCNKCQTWKRIGFFGTHTKAQISKGYHRFRYSCQQCENKRKATQKSSEYQKADVAEFFSKL